MNKLLLFYIINIALTGILAFSLWNYGDNGGMIAFFCLIAVALLSPIDFIINRLKGTNYYLLLPLTFFFFMVLLKSLLKPQEGITGMGYIFIIEYAIYIVLCIIYLASRKKPSVS